MGLRGGGILKIKQYDCATGETRIVDVPDVPQVHGIESPLLSMTISVDQLRADIDYIAMKVGVELE